MHSSKGAERLQIIKNHVSTSSHLRIQDTKADSNMAGGRAYEYIQVSVIGRKNNIGLIKLDRPRALNALFDPLMTDISDALDDFESDESIACVIMTGSSKTFSVGADIKQMAPVASFTDIYKVQFPKYWDRIALFKKPLIAAVNGYAYGGGCEIAMMCDIIYAGDKATFGQPEIRIGTIPGAGGTQRLPRLVGKSKAMEMILSGDPITAQEAKEYGLVAGVFPADQLLAKTLEKVERIADNSPFITSIAKEAVGRAYEMSLAEGLHFEKRLFHSTFATEDRQEGMMAFIEKREPNYVNA